MSSFRSECHAGDFVGFVQRMALAFWMLPLLLSRRTDLTGRAGRAPGLETIGEMK